MYSLILSEDNEPYESIKKLLVHAQYEILIISPYIKAATLRKLIPLFRSPVTVITSWRINDLWFGSSDLGLYNLSREYSFPVYLNNEIHLKAYISDKEKCIFGSANLTEKGMGLTEEFNYELCGQVESLDVKTLFYIEHILNNSRLLDDELYNEFVNAVSQLEEIPEFKDIDINTIDSSQQFLISALPMSDDIEKLFHLYSKGYKNSDRSEVECAIHDVVLYRIKDGLSKDEFIKALKEEFFNSPFIIKFLEFIDEDERYFGRVKEWVQNNCTDVPVPSRRDLTGNIQVLYKWVVTLSDGKYQVDRPNHSERIYRSK